MSSGLYISPTIKEFTSAPEIIRRVPPVCGSEAVVVVGVDEVVVVLVVVVVLDVVLEQPLSSIPVTKINVNASNRIFLSIYLLSSFLFSRPGFLFSYFYLENLMT